MAEQECSLLGGPFALVVQGGLAAGALCTLAYKRAVERPRRSLLVWSFDASKQAWAGTLQHGVNLLLGVWLARGGGRASECAWYLLNFTISIGCGIFLLWAAMRAYRQLVERFGLTMLRSGEYGNPPSWKPWLAQLVVWGAISAGEKLLTALLLILPLHGSLDKFAWWVERPLGETRPPLACNPQCVHACASHYAYPSYECAPLVHSSLKHVRPSCMHVPLACMHASYLL